MGGGDRKFYQFRRFIQAVIERYGGLYFLHGVFELVPIIIIVGRVDSVDEQGAYLTGIHIRYEGVHFAVDPLPYLKGGGPADRSSIGADGLIDGIYDHLYIGIVAAAHYERFPFIFQKVFSGLLNAGF